MSSDFVSGSGLSDKTQGCVVKKLSNNVQFIDITKKNTEMDDVMDWDKQDVFDMKKNCNGKDLNEKVEEERKTNGLCNEKSCHATSPHRYLKGGLASSRKKDDFPNNGSDSIRGDNSNKNEENVKECCRRKRKRHELEIDNSNFMFQGLTCIGILPGLGTYVDSSDDSDLSCSSGSEGNEHVLYDLVGRRIVEKSKDDS